MYYRCFWLSIRKYLYFTYLYNYMHYFKLKKPGKLIFIIELRVGCSVWHIFPLLTVCNGIPSCTPPFAANQRPLSISFSLSASLREDCRVTSPVLPWSPARHQQGGRALERSILSVKSLSAGTTVFILKLFLYTEHVTVCSYTFMFCVTKLFTPCALFFFLFKYFRSTSFLPHAYF